MAQISIIPKNGITFIIVWSLMSMLVACTSSTTSVPPSNMQIESSPASNQQLTPMNNTTEAKLTITAVLHDCSSDASQYPDDCDRRPYEHVFLLKKEDVVIEEIMLTNFVERTLTPGTYTIEPSDFLAEPGVESPEPKTVQLQGGEEKTIGFIFYLR